MGVAGSGRDARAGTGDRVNLEPSKVYRAQRCDRDLSPEVESYLAHEIDENLARGMTPGEARFAALRKLGNATHVREEIYEMNTVRVLAAV